MKTCIDFNDFTGLDTELFNLLKKNDTIFRESDTFTKVLENANIIQLVHQIDAFCLSNLIYGYHYTRASRESILKYGLLVRSGETIRNEFLSQYRHIFTQIELNIIESNYLKFNNDQNKETRDNLVFFNFINDYSGTDDLLGYFGGEQVYSPIRNYPSLLYKLSKIGTPLTVKCKLNPNDLNTFIDKPWGKICVSSYHSKINSLVYHICDQDGYQYVPVNPENIEIL